MCGIAGTVGGPPDRQLLERMAESMWKRGPDGQGVWLDEQAGIACRRLAIIDLHERSNQPLHLGPLHIVFNGEIYNYKELREELRGLGHGFETEGDVEVLLHAWEEWGEGALERVNGMFAFAIWNDSDSSLVLASDPFGEKPLYYAVTRHGLVFASDIKALLLDPAVSAAANEDALALFFSRGAMPPPAESFLSGIVQLPAAHVARWQRGRLETRRYWHPRRVDVPADYQEATSRLRDLMHDSIRLRLRSDVPVGTSLSGGVDSSCVVALAAEIAGDHTRHAFTARFPGFERDEWCYAEQVARLANVVEHHAVEPTGDDLLRELETFVLDQEEPVGSASVYAQWCVMRSAKEAGVVVLLDGQGGDELFGGYPIAAGFALRASGPATTLRELVASPRRAGQVGRSFAMDLLPSRLRTLYWERISTPYAAADVAASAARQRSRLEDWIREARPLRRELLTQAFETSLPQLLRYGDRSSMAHSRELRLPFLDRRVAEFALSLPSRFLYRDGVSKRILRDLARDLVPDSVLSRRDKVAYEPPQRDWLDAPAFRERIAEVLLDPSARSRGLYDSRPIEEDFRAGAWRDPDGIWRALNAELWIRAFTEHEQRAPQAA
jgi:asparagine synthase (glutamine-hydrolysing)